MRTRRQYRLTALIPMCRSLFIITAALALSLALADAPVAQQTGEENNGFNKGGRTAFQFVKIGVGAQQAALGEASIAGVRDVSSAFWNPAGIMGIERYEAAFSYTQWLADMSYVGAAVGGQVGNIGTFALTVASLDYGQIPEAIVDERSDGRTGQSFSGGDVVLGLAYARQFTERLVIGVGVKYLHENLWEFSTGTFAFDVGTTYDVGWRGLAIAMALQNYSQGVRFSNADFEYEESYDIPLVFRVGLTGNLFGQDAFIGLDEPHQLTASIEAINSNDYGERLHLGAEYVYGGFLALRGGYRINYAEGNWSLGAGILTPAMGGVRLRADYAYVGYEFLNAPHRFTVLISF
jgi:hypothetical protein